jgi:DNA-directed RNA polymerase specialized sigma24 family protein
MSKSAADLEVDDGTRRLLRDVRMRSREAENALWLELFEPTVRLLAGWYGSRRRFLVDEQDTAVDAMEQLYLLIRTGHCAEMKARHELWALTRRLARRKFLSALRSQSQQKRALARASTRFRLDELPGRVVSDFELCAETDELLAVLNLPDDNKLWAVLNLRYMGCSRSEIGSILKMSISTVNRHLRDLYGRWQKRASGDSAPRSDRNLFFVKGLAIPAKRPPPRHPPETNSRS